MEDKKKYEKSQSDCETYIQKIRDYCGQIKLKYSEPNVILRRNQKKQISESSKSSNLSRQSSIDSLNDRSPTKNKPTSGSSIKKKDRFAESYYKDVNKFRVPSSTSQKKNESARNPLNDDDAHSPDLFAKTSINIATSPKKTESTRRSNSNDADDPAREPNYKSSNKNNPNNLRTSRNSNERELKTREYESRRNNDTSRKSNEPSSIKRTLSRSLRTSPSSPSDKQPAIIKKLNNNDETKIQNTQLQTQKKKVRKPSVSTSPANVDDDDVRFKGKFDIVSNCDISNFPKCCICKKEYEGEFEVIACPDCKHWMHIECFVDHVYEQRRQNKRLTCPECGESYF